MDCCCKSFCDKNCNWNIFLIFCLIDFIHIGACAVDIVIKIGCSIIWPGYFSHVSLDIYIAQNWKQSTDCRYTLFAFVFMFVFVFVTAFLFVWESTFVFWSRKVGNFILHRIESNQLSISRNGKIQNVLFQTMENNQQSIF